ncbi:MAG: hypothetical protein AAGA25_15325 [Planctomycetota bacterium]
MIEVIMNLGIATSVIGLGIEGLAIFAMINYRIRKRVPNPFTLQTVGVAMFVLGLVIAAGTAAWMETVQEFSSP